MVSAIQCYQYLRDICSWRFTSVYSPLLLGGPVVVVQIDESLFRHKPKVKYIVVEMHLFIAVSLWAAITFRAMGFWDLMVDTSQTPALGVMVLVQRRDPALRLCCLKIGLKGTILNLLHPQYVFFAVMGI